MRSEEIRRLEEIERLKEELGLEMLINPEFAAAETIVRILRFPSALKIDTFAHGRVELLKFRLPEDSILAGMSVKDAAIKLKCDLLFCTVEMSSKALQLDKSKEKCVFLLICAHLFVPLPLNYKMQRK